MSELACSFLGVVGSCGLVLLVTVILRARSSKGRRAALLEALTILAVFLVIITEIASALRLLTTAVIGVVWLVVVLAALVAARYRLDHPLPEVVAREIRLMTAMARNLPLPVKVAVSLMAGAGALLLALAVGVPPNNYDAMTYHLARVMHWQQNQSLAFYPTSIPPQLILGPMAEMVILHSILLTGGDRLANAVQFAAMLGCLAGVSLLAKRMGGNRSTQVLAALVTLTLPMGVLQASSSQNDYVAAFWCVCFAVYTTAPETRDGSWRCASIAGAALGLGILTKATTIPILAPLGAWYGIRAWRRYGLDGLKWPMLVATLAALIVMPHSLRNYAIFGNLLGMGEDYGVGYYVNGSADPRIAASNALRNLGLELALPWESANHGLQMAIEGLHATLGVDVNDARSTFPGATFRIYFSMSENVAGNPMAVLVLLCVIPWLLRKHSSAAAAHLACIAAGFVLYCAVLRWQPWQSRLLLPLFILSMPLAAIGMMTALRDGGARFVAVVLTLAAVPYLVANPNKPLLGPESVFLTTRVQQRFPNAPDELRAYQKAADLIGAARCTQIGLAIGSNSREYPLWVLVREKLPEARFEHILVSGESQVLLTRTAPCAIVVTESGQPFRMIYQGETYRRAWRNRILSLYLSRSLSP